MCPSVPHAEPTILDIDAWDADEAVQLSQQHFASHRIKPYGFYFSTTGPDPDNPRRDAEIARSPFHFIGGKKLSQQEVKDLYGESSILHQNMVGNGYEAVVLSNNPSWCQPFRTDDVIVQPPESPRR